MGAPPRRPPLPAPTDISSSLGHDAKSSALGRPAFEDANSGDEDLGTELSKRTDRTHYSIPEDGSPVTITTRKKEKSKEGSKSQTSLLIEYYEGQVIGESRRPSLRVRVTPSASKGKKHGAKDHIRISEETGSGRPTHVRRISIPAVAGADRDSHSPLSEVSSGPAPMEVDILHNGSEISSDRYIVDQSEVSAMPPSLIDGPTAAVLSPRKKRSMIQEEVETRDSLQAPKLERARSTSESRLIRRLVKPVKEKVQDQGFHSKSSKRKTSGESRSRRVSEELLEDKGKGRKYQEESEISAVSATGSTASINNPKFLQAVEDAIKTLIPELQAEEHRVSRSKSTRGELDREESVKSHVARERRPSKSSVTSTREEEQTERRHRSRRGSAESVRSRESSVRGEEKRRRKSGEKEKIAAGVVGGALLAAGAAALLKKRPSESSVKETRRRRSSGSRTPSRSERREHEEREEREQREYLEEERDQVEEPPTRAGRVADIHSRKRDVVPPLPMQSVMESDLTRASILSADTERPLPGVKTPVPVIKEVSRGASRHTISPAASGRLREHVASHQHDHWIPDDRSSSTAQPHFGGMTGAAALTGAAAAATYALGHHSYEKSPRTPTRDVSPVQSDNSYFYEREDIAQHPRVRSIKSINSLSSERRRARKASPLSGSPSPQLSQSRDRKREGISLESPYEILQEEDERYQAETPSKDEVDQWLAQEHEQNERYRQQNNRESRFTDGEHTRDTMYTEDSQFTDATQHNVRTLGANPEYVHTPVAVNSAVASLQGGHSPISIQSSESSIRDRGQVASQGDVSETLVAAGVQPHNWDSKSRWEQIRDRAMALSHRHSLDAINFESPRQSPTRSIIEEEGEEDDEPIMSSTYVPVPGDIPEIGIVPDDESELLTNPSIISDRLGEGIDMPSYEPSPNISRDIGSSRGRDAALLGGAAAAAAGLGLVAAGRSRKHYATVEEEPEEAEDRELLDEELPAEIPSQKEAFISLAEERGTPAPDPIAIARLVSGTVGDEYGSDLDEEDPFTTQRSLRRESGPSQVINSPLYEAATGKGMDHIQSKDVVALMDHLTVRDGHRNAVDTEILVTLVRSAAEMRNNFEEMKRHIEQHDRMILTNMEKHHDKTVRVLNGPRPMPGSSTGSQTPRGMSAEAIDAPAKKRNFIKRALRGLGARNSDELAKIQDMLMHLLNEVETLKDAQGVSGGKYPPTAASMNSYEHLRAAPIDDGYEPGGRTATNNSPGDLSQGYLSNSSTRYGLSVSGNGLHSMHSGYGGENRISTVLEGDEDLDEAVLGTAKAHAIAANQKATETQVASQTPPEQTTRDMGSAEQTPRTEKTKSRYKSGASSIFSAIPRVSRWSKTTASTIPESIRNSVFASGGKKGERPASHHSLGESLDSLGDEYDEYQLDPDDRLRSQGSLVGNQQGLERGPGSPLIPSQGSSQHRRSHSYGSAHHPDEEDYDEYEMQHAGDSGDSGESYEYEDPKYQAHRNSLNLQHPQPKHGPTYKHRHQLEREAMVFENPPTPEAELWGSAPALALGRRGYVPQRASGHSQQSRLSQEVPVDEHHVSPVQSDDDEGEFEDEEGDAEELHDGQYHAPHSQAQSQHASSYASQQQQQSTAGGYAPVYSNNVPLMSSGMHIASPLEPIEEVRNSLETDRHSILRDDDVTPEPTTARPVVVGGRLHPGARQTEHRRPSGPRDMPPSRGNSGRSAARGGHNDSPVSFDSRTGSFESETF